MPKIELSVDDSEVRAVITKARRFTRRAMADIQKDVDQTALEFMEVLKDKASHRPGPRVITGAYLESFFFFKPPASEQEGVAASGVGTLHPAGPRLEYGFVGIDAIGRHYNQPPFPHWRPTAEIVGGRWYRRYFGIVKKWWD